MNGWKHSLEDSLQISPNVNIQFVTDKTIIWTLQQFHNMYYLGLHYDFVLRSGNDRCYSRFTSENTTHMQQN
jgi:hypothetical protein